MGAPDRHRPGPGAGDATGPLDLRRSSTWEHGSRTRRRVARVATAGLIALAIAAARPAPGHAQAIDTTLWVTNGYVYSVAAGNGRIYLGGNFSQVGPATGGGVPLDTTTGAPLPSFPKVTGSVNAPVPDAHGGWFIGGDFTAVGGFPRNNLAQVNADGTVSAWDPNARDFGRIYAMTILGSTVYVTGGAGKIGGALRHGVAALDGSTGQAMAFDPGVIDINNNFSVLALAASGSSIYVGGHFQTMGGQPRSNIAAVDATSGAATAWNPSADQAVTTLAVLGSKVYAGGGFSTIGGQLRRHIAAIDSFTGAATAWDPSASGQVTAIAPTDSIVYAGGWFDSIGATPRAGIAALDVTTGTATAWNPGTGALAGYGGSRGVSALALCGSTLFAGGYFDSIGGVPRHRLAAFDALTGAVTSWNPNADDHVNTITPSGSAVFVGGVFHSLGGQPRYGLAALDATTGALTGWDPNPDHQVMEVHALVFTGSVVYVGGYFGRIGGSDRPRLAAIDATTGLATSWNPNLRDANQVFAIAVSGSTVYAGGSFTTAGGQHRLNLVALDASTGAATGFVADTDWPSGYVRALAVQGSTLYVGGDFTSINGVTRNYLAALDATTGAVTSWQPSVSGRVQAIAASATTVYVGSGFGTTYGGFDPVAFEASTGSVNTAWKPPIFGVVFSLLLSDCTVFAGGDIPTNTKYILDWAVATDATTGKFRSWEPGGMDGQVLSMAFLGSKLYMGGYFTEIGGHPQNFIAGISIAPTLTATTPTRGGNDGRVTATLSGSFLVSCSAVKLARPGQLDIPGTGVVAADDDGSLAATFDLRGAAPGAWDVVLQNPDTDPVVLANAFTVTSVAGTQLRVDIVGPDSIRAGYPTAFDLVIGNPGNVDAEAIPVWLSGIPADATVAFDFPLTAPVASGGEPDWSQAPDTLGLASGRCVALVIPRIPPGSVTRRVLLSVPGTVTGFRLHTAVTPPWADGSTLRTCLAGNGVTHDAACVETQLSTLQGELATNFQAGAMNGIAAWARTGWRCEGASTLTDAVTSARRALDFLSQAIAPGDSVPAGCSDVLRPLWRDSLQVAVVGSVDPNEKDGKRGVLSSLQAIPYAIHFENTATATAPAQRVTVVDVLPAPVDVSTVSLVAVTFGSTQLYPLPGLNHGTWDVDLGASRNIVVRVEAGFSGPAQLMRQLVWTFTSLNRQTLRPLDPSSLDGFLPPNHNPPEGEGSVVFTVMPLPGLGTGTVIANQASIVFDYNPAQVTPAWQNTVDNSPPASRVLPLASVGDSAVFAVRWEAVGGPSDLRDFTIYAREDSSAFRVWRLCTPATADTFSGRQGHTYSFYSQARDTLGNIEPAHATADAQTGSVLAVGPGARWQLSLAGARPNPAVGAIRAWFTLPGKEPAALELFDVAGRRVQRHEVGELGAGQHMVLLGQSSRIRTGMYFLRLSQGRQALRARVVMVR